ncbi:hypothetical protein [Halorubrum sp. Ea8]|uniref:hypothetical protein n=1 Tax=Halorubrum sp. Ea8 TaxID=1383841 RepID=UPI000B98A7EF|nr:hypothetical protein [Halorubrum sp. Ea8]OYR51992.1 hypothetical protein DJ74_02580 [Halorubrum sp. Ea8]
MTDEEAGGPAEGAGGGRIRSIAVHREDVASALEATLRSDREVVLRVTPPFSGRMRARLHAVDHGTAGEEAGGSETSERDGDSPTPIHVDPRDLVAEVPPYPEVDETAAAHPDADIETRRERHAEAVEAWRERVRGSIVDAVELEVDGETRAVDVTALG